MNPKVNNIKIGDKVKTTAWLDILSDVNYLQGEVQQIINQKCLDNTNFEKIYVEFEDGRILPCVREELQIIY